MMLKETFDVTQDLTQGLPEDFTEDSGKSVHLAVTIAAGSVLGYHHRQLGLNNQDAWGWEQGDWGTIAVVCDGCGGTPHSEVGSQVGVRFILQSLREALLRGEDPQSPTFFPSLQTRLLQQLRQFAESLGGDPLVTLRDYCLFTIVGTVITPKITSVFGLGDGVYALNGAIKTLQDSRKSLGDLSPNGSESSDFKNAPPYLAYGLLEPKFQCFSAEELQLQVYVQCPTVQVYSLLIGTDGVEDLRAVADQCLPGKLEPVGVLAQFWENDRYFTNPHTLHRRLSLINREVIQPDWLQHQLQKHRGLLPDDTTLICLRRQVGTESAPQGV